MEARVKRSQPTQPPTPTAAAVAAPASSVLGDDDLLRLEFPTSLVRAAAVCRRWLGVASDPAFLRRFHDLHPPRLLGFYSDIRSFCWVEFSPVPQFVPMLPQPPELAAVIRRGGFNLEVLDNHERLATRILDCRSGRVLILYYDIDGRFTHRVYRPLHAARDMSTVPPLPVINVEGCKRFIFSESFSKEGVDGLSYFWLTMMLDWEGKAIARTYMLQDDVWRMHSYATTQLYQTPVTTQLGRTISGMSKVLSVGDRIYMTATISSILVLDLTSSSFFTIELPCGLVFNEGGTMLSRADGNGVYLVHLKDLKLCIWINKVINRSEGDWSLLNTICLLDMCADLRMVNVTVEDERTSVVHLNAVADNAKFVFFNMDECVLYLDVRSRTLHKVEELMETYVPVGQIHPFMMVWPPIFPALKEEY